MSNLEILIFILGYQGGTLKQVSDELCVSETDILYADKGIMLELCKLARDTYEKRLDGYAKYMQDAPFYLK